MPRILVVDDDDACRCVIKAHLSHAYEVIDTAYPQDALAMAVDQRPDVILLDLLMPGMSGFELCRTLTSLVFTQKIPIFIISGGDDRNKAFCQNLGASKYFNKPIDFTKLKESLAWATRTNRIERRRDVRVPLKIPLTLRGRRKDGTEFEARIATEDVSRGGFLCASNSPLEDATTVEVFLLGNHERRLGHARLVRVVQQAGSNPRYGFQFTGVWAEPLFSASA